MIKNFVSVFMLNSWEGGQEKAPPCKHAFIFFIFQWGIATFGHNVINALKLFSAETMYLE